MSKLHKISKLDRIQIRYMIIMIALAILAIAKYKNYTTNMRYYSEVTANVVGYAKETRSDSYTVVFNSNGGTGSMANMSIKFGASVNLTQNSFTKANHTFNGWNTEPDGTGTDYTDGELVTNITTENVLTINLYAQWIDASLVAEVNGTTYTSIYTAISNVPNNVQTTVKLLKDITISQRITVPTSKNIIFNLQGHTITNTNGADLPIIENEGTLTLVNGTIRTTSSQGAVNNQNGGSFTISSGQIISAGTKQAIYNDSGTVLITGTAYIESSSNQRAAVQNQPDGIMTITGGTIISTLFSGVDNAGTLTIGTEDGNVSRVSPVILGETYGVDNSNKTVAKSYFDFYDGIIKGKTERINTSKIEVDQMETGYNLWLNTEEINGEIYKTACLGIVKVVTFDPNGGLTNEPTRTLEEGSEIGPLPTATMAGHVLDGWYTAANGRN